MTNQSLKKRGGNPWTLEQICVVPVNSCLQQVLPWEKQAHLCDCTPLPHSHWSEKRLCSLVEHTHIPYPAGYSNWPPTQRWKWTSSQGPDFWKHVDMHTDDPPHRHSSSAMKSTRQKWGGGRDWQWLGGLITDGSTPPTHSEAAHLSGGQWSQYNEPIWSHRCRPTTTTTDCVSLEAVF